MLILSLSLFYFSSRIAYLLLKSPTTPQNLTPFAKKKGLTLYKRDSDEKYTLI